MFIMNPLAWQSSDRVSVRLAAKGTTPEASSSAQGARYTEQPYYQENVYSSSSEMTYTQQQTAVALSPAVQSNPNSTMTNAASSSKRPLPEPEATSPPKAKKAKSKAKSTSTGSQVASSISTSEYPSCVFGVHSDSVYSASPLSPFLCPNGSQLTLGVYRRSADFHPRNNFLFVILPFGAHLLRRLNLYKLKAFPIDC